MFPGHSSTCLFQCPTPTCILCWLSNNQFKCDATRVYTFRTGYKMVVSLPRLYRAIVWQRAVSKLLYDIPSEEVSATSAIIYNWSGTGRYNNDLFSLKIMFCRPLKQFKRKMLYIWCQLKSRIPKHHERNVVLNWMLQCNALGLFYI